MVLRRYIIAILPLLPICPSTGEEEIIESFRLEIALVDQVDPRHLPIVESYKREFGLHPDDISLPITTEQLHRMCRAVVESPTCQTIGEEYLLRCDRFDEIAAGGTMASLSSIGSLIQRRTTESWSFIHDAVESILEGEALSHIQEGMEDFRRNSFAPYYLSYAPLTPGDPRLAAVMALISLGIEDAFNAVHDLYQTRKRLHCFDIDIQNELLASDAIDIASLVAVPTLRALQAFRSKSIVIMDPRVKKEIGKLPYKSQKEHVREFIEAADRGDALAATPLAQVGKKLFSHRIDHAYRLVFSLTNETIQDIRRRVVRIIGVEHHDRYDRNNRRRRRR